MLFQIAGNAFLVLALAALAAHFGGAYVLPVLRRLLGKPAADGAGGARVSAEEKSERAQRARERQAEEFAAAVAREKELKEAREERQREATRAQYDLRLRSYKVSHVLEGEADAAEARSRQQREADEAAAAEQERAHRQRWLEGEQRRAREQARRARVVDGYEGDVAPLPTVGMSAQEIRAAQDAEYEQSLIEDQLKEELRMARSMLREVRGQLFDALPEEPPAESGAAATVVVRLPEGSVTRRFALDSPLVHVFDFALGHPEAPAWPNDGIELATNYPRRVFTRDEHGSLTLDALGEGKRVLLFAQAR